MAGIIYCQKMGKGNQLRKKYTEKLMVRHLYLTISVCLFNNYECGFSISLVIDKELFLFCKREANTLAQFVVKGFT